MRGRRPLASQPTSPGTAAALRRRGLCRMTTDGRLPSHQRHVCADFSRWSGSAGLEPFPQELDSATSDLRLVRGQGGKRGYGEPTVLDVVKTDDGYVVWHCNPPVGQRSKCAQRQRVGEAEDRVRCRARVQQLRHRRAPSARRNARTDATNRSSAATSYWPNACS